MRQMEKYAGQRESWADEARRSINWPSVVAALMVLVLSGTVWVIRQDQVRIQERVTQLELAARTSGALPPEGFEIVP